MRKYLVLIPVLICVGAFAASAQMRVGIIAGPTINKVEGTRYHAGASFQYLHRSGFGIQPSVLFNVKSASEGYLEVPVDLQWGPDLGLFRPYLAVTPYWSMTVYSRCSDEPRRELGCGFGGGVELFGFQLSARYNMGTIYRYSTISLAYFF